MEIDQAGDGTGDAAGPAPSATGAGARTWTAPPVRTTPVSGAGASWLWVGALLLVAAWMASPALFARGPATSPATVVGPGDEPGRTEVRVLEGPRPSTWAVDGVVAPAGSQIEVELHGECGCEPYPLRRRPTTNWLSVLLFGGLGAVTARRASQQSRAHRVTRTAGALLARPPGPGAYRLEPMVFARGALDLRFALRRMGDDVVIGTVPLSVGISRSDLERPVRIHGDPRPGAVIALSTDGGEEGLLPTEPLTTMRSARAASPHPATAVVVDLLGLGEVSAASKLGATGRITPAQFGPDRYPAAIVEATRASRSRWVAAGVWQRRSLVVGLGAIVLLAATVGGRPVVMGAVVAMTVLEMAFSHFSPRWADRPLADALAETGLVSSDALRVARLLMRCNLAAIVAERTGDPDATEP